MTTITKTLPAVALTTDERQTLISALHDALFEVERYMRGAKVNAKPAPDESCCAHHLARWERNRENYLALKARRRGVRRLIKKLSKGLHDDRSH